MPSTVKNAAHRVGNFLRLEARGGDLVQKRLEQVIVVPIDQDDFDRNAPQFSGQRESAEPGTDELTIGDLTISVSAHTVRRDKTLLQLTPLEFDLLLALAKRPSHVFSREALLDEVWGYRNAADTRLVNVHVQRLRSKVEKDPERPEIIVTVRGIGYRAGEATPA